MGAKQSEPKLFFINRILIWYLWLMIEGLNIENLTETKSAIFVEIWKWNNKMHFDFESVYVMECKYSSSILNSPLVSTSLYFQLQNPPMTVDLLVDTALDRFNAYFLKRWMGKCHCGINGTTTDRARPTKRRSGTKVCARSLSLARHTPLGEFLK